MQEHIYKQIELTGTSEQSIEHAVERAISKASESLRGIHWFEVLETRGAVQDGGKLQWQVIVKVAFTLDD